MSLLTLVLVTTATTSFAAGKYVITSSSQVKNGSLSKAELSAAARRQLKGARGPRGAQGLAGPQGDPGPSHAYSGSLTTTEALPAGTSVTISTPVAPAGSYVVTARLQGETGSDADPGNNYRFDCSLFSGGTTFDSVTYRVGYDASVERYLTFQGAGRTTTDAPISLTCSAGNGHDLVVISGQVDAVQVGAVD